ncbi:MAG: hypothetical protein Q8R44_09520, partial [Novosphingobium sp.]|nr:hypothetical protein [Novosphingobium sp.]
MRQNKVSKHLSADTNVVAHRSSCRFGISSTNGRKNKGVIRKGLTHPTRLLEGKAAVNAKP